MYNKKRFIKLWTIATYFKLKNLFYFFALVQLNKNDINMPH